MLAVVLLFVCLTAKAEEFNPLGRAIYLPNYNVMGKLEETGTEVLKTSLIEKCSVKTSEPISSQTFHFYKDTKTFYSSVTSSSSLSTSMQADFSLGFTLDTTSKSITGSKRTVTGNSMLILGQTYQSRIYKECLQEQDNLAKGFVDDFKKLQVIIDKPWMKSAWTGYDAFLRKYGSHVVTSITYGSSINQMAFADTSESYTQRDFQVKTCMSLSGGRSSSEVQTMGVDLCAGVDQTEINKVTSMTMSDDLVLCGGTTETRNALLIERSAELINQFMNEASVTNATISYNYMSVWELLQLVYAGVDEDNFVRAVNMEYYYLGFLNYGCQFSEYGGQELQKFTFTKYHAPNAPQYECSLAPQGCHNPNDCHYKPIWCSCRGSSCVRYRDTVLDTGDVKTVASANEGSDWGWQGCDWKPGLAGSYCICRWPSSTRTVVWSLDDKSFMYMAIGRMEKAIKATQQKKGKKNEL